MKIEESLLERGTIAKRLKEILSIQSVTGNEKELGSYLEHYMRELGLYTKIRHISPNRFNVYGMTGKNCRKPRLMLNGHFDTVPEGEGWIHKPYSGEIEEDRIFGRGAVDMKGGLVAMIEAAGQIQRSETSQSSGGRVRENDDCVIVTAVVGEEDDQVGTKKIVEDELFADYAIVGEPTKLEIVVAHKGDVTYEIVVHGKSAHASQPELGINSIYHAAKIILELEKEASRIRETGIRDSLLGAGALSVNVIHGGTVPSVIPAECRIQVDRRTVPGEDERSVERELRSTVERVSELYGEKLNVEIRNLVTAETLTISKDHILVRSLSESCKEISTMNPSIVGAPYTTDGWLLHKAGIPTVVFGPGDIFFAHKPDEWVSIDEVRKACLIYARTAQRILRT